MEKNDKYNDKLSLQAIEKKLDFFKDTLQKTILHVKKIKNLDVLGESDVTTCIDRLTELSKKINEITEQNVKNTELLINNLQIINNEFSSLFKSYGTNDLEDLLVICFGNNSKITTTESEQMKYELLKKFFHPTSYKIINRKDDKNKKKISDDLIDEKTPNLTCFDISTNFKQFHMKVYGIKIYIHNFLTNKSIIIYGVIDDIILDLFNNKYINLQKHKILDNVPDDTDFKSKNFTNFISSLTLKDYFIYNDNNEVYNKFAGYMSQMNSSKQKTISQIVKEFIADDLYSKRLILIQLLIKSDNYENQYLAYLLYDILSNDSNGNIDTQEQVKLFDSFPWSIKQHFKTAMKKTIQYTNELSNFDINKIPLEQQICLLKANDNVKEKAMIKLKEVKSKTEDSGSKARQYLDGLLKIPFNIYKKEPILNLMDIIKGQFKDIYKKYDISKIIPEIKLKDKYTSIEVLKYMNLVKNKFCCNNYDTDFMIKIKKRILTGDKNELLTNISNINDSITISKMELPKIKYSHKKKNEIKAELDTFLNNCFENHNNHNNHSNHSKNNKGFLPILDKLFNNKTICSPKSATNNINKDIDEISYNLNKITDYIGNVKQTLDSAVHGHEKAKKQVERIIGQWINGNQDGYCFGFEGPPGVGKTSLAKKGLSDCLKDDDGNSRPFAMIQMGGDSNGSTIHGHNYTYVGSTWGSIVQILIDKKCMNPIIFIDEVDKISKTEHGKEIVGILTHLLDPAQNDCFQDKYFTGIDLDLSKALFILSYNDVDAIDKILLDRIHRIKFDSLSIEDKLVISNSHILPEVYKKMGLEDMIYFSNEVLKFIIEEYTSESGVRKLKEVLFEIVGEINLDILKNASYEFELPIKITIEDVKNKYFKDKHEVKHKKIHNENKIGVINGLWANSLGKGGVIPIQANFYPADKFLSLKLTGMQGDVMKESMNVALTLAWNLTKTEFKSEIREKHANVLSGVHIHCPEGAVHKDGPSAGAAITTTIYSLFNNLKIKHNIAITGEISLDGFITEIGGLDLKILGAIKAGVKEILFPVENKKDYNKFFEKYKDDELIKDIKFYPVNQIQEVFEIVFE
jgi:ATP-dependent Lon protease